MAEQSPDSYSAPRFVADGSVERRLYPMVVTQQRLWSAVSFRTLLTTRPIGAFHAGRAGLCGGRCRSSENGRDEYFPDQSLSFVHKIGPFRYPEGVFRGIPASMRGPIYADDGPNRPAESAHRTVARMDRFVRFLDGRRGTPAHTAIAAPDRRAIAHEPPPAFGQFAAKLRNPAGGDTAIRHTRVGVRSCLRTPAPRESHGNTNVAHRPLDYAQHFRP